VGEDLLVAARLGAGGGVVEHAFRDEQPIAFRDVRRGAPGTLIYDIADVGWLWMDLRRRLLSHPGAGPPRAADR
jgi:hypothetical protein